MHLTQLSNVLNITPKPFQSRFCLSDARFPAAIWPWATGKTLFGLWRGISLSKLINNNLGLVVRREFTDLRDSTIKDFELYTGMTVSKDTKEARFKDTGSVIMFRHGDELSALQNINLGWWMVEQADEFETDSEFEFLRGRLRRKNVPFPTGFILANAKGQNWVWKLWVNNPPSKEFFAETNITTFDNADNLPAGY